MTAERSGEERLARAVIAQALTDAGIHPDSRERISVPRPVEDAARNFLTAHSGSWKAVRHYWAAMADLDPEKLRIRTMKLLGIEPPPMPIEAPKKPTNEPLRLFIPVPKPPKAPRPSMRREVYEMLSRPEGVSAEEVMDHFGWNRGKALAYLKFEMRFYGVEASVCRDGRYRAFKRAEDGRLIAEAA